MNISSTPKSNLKNIIIALLLLKLAIIGVSYLYSIFSNNSENIDFYNKSPHILVDILEIESIRNKQLSVEDFMIEKKQATRSKQFKSQEFKGQNDNKILELFKPTFKNMVLVTVSCGDRRNETHNLIKSAAALSISNLVIIVFTEKQHMKYFSSMNIQWPSYIQDKVKLDVREAIYPSNVDEKKWRPLFRQCSSLRLFMPTILHDVDSILYVDLDILLMNPVDHFWNQFTFMNSSQMVALVPEHLDLAMGWYNRFAKHPYYGRLGLNSGVMLMNLTRMRMFSWDEYPESILDNFHKDLRWGDQDIINIIFHYHPEKVYVMGCENNFRPDYCMYVNTCKSVETTGVRAFHGSRFAFTGNKYPAFKTIYKAWSKYKLGENLRKELYYPMQRYLLKTRHTNCGKLYKGFLKGLQEIADPL